MGVEGLRVILKQYCLLLDYFKWTLWVKFRIRSGFWELKELSDHLLISWYKK